MLTDSILRALARGAFLSVLLAPFLFGAVERTVWIPLCQAWLMLGLVSEGLRRTAARDNEQSLADVVIRALLPIHALFALQLTPMPGWLMQWLSLGSWNASFLANPADSHWRTLSVSSGATAEAWLYVGALQGLFLALQALPSWSRRSYLLVVVAVITVLGAEGLWQSRSAHPNWLYGLVEVNAPQGLENGTFGPYFNRNHFATLTAIGASLAAGLAIGLVRPAEALSSLVRDQSRVIRVVCLAGLSAFLALATAASGSRSGLLAAAVGIAAALAQRFRRASVLGALIAGTIFVVLSGALSVERLLSAGLVVSRVPAWTDMARMISFFPVFGCGIGAFGPGYWPYQLNVRYEFWQHAHNEYLEWLIEGGILGCVAFGIALGRLRTRVDASEGAWEPLVAALGAFVTQAFVEFPARVPANAAIVVCILAICVRRRESPEI